MTIIPLLIIISIGSLLDIDKLRERPLIESEKNIEVQIIFPDRQTKPEPNTCLNVKVLIINHTDTIASFFEDWNSWGYFNLSFQVATIDTTFILYKKSRNWPKNFPSFKTLFPGDTLLLAYSLDYEYCDDSQFEGTISKATTRPTKIKAIYQLPKEALTHADLKGTIKYKRVYNKGTNRYNGSWVIVDSLMNPVEINRTFPLSKLESREYELR